MSWRGARRAAPVCDGPRLLGAAVRRAPTSDALLTSRARRARRQQGCDGRARSTTRRRSAAERPRRSRTARWSAGSRDAWNGGRARSATARILCDPRRADMKDILNLKIKRRESFRPFAPSILREAVAEWFEADDDVPFMMQVYPIREERRALDSGGDPRRRIGPAADGDGARRIRCYYRLIEAFARLTGVPMVLNTSFNENEPVVCRPEEALDCFLRTRMDVLVLGDTLHRADARESSSSSTGSSIQTSPPRARCCPIWPMRWPNDHDVHVVTSRLNLRARSRRRLPARASRSSRRSSIASGPRGSAGARCWGATMDYVTFYVSALPSADAPARARRCGRLDDR